ncbi:MAG TPA: ABC transporter permease [Acidobacteriaceae bacterium]|jgi:predicted permease
MRLLDKLRMRGRTLFIRGTVGSELDRELRFHLDEQIAENRAAGMNEIEARQAAMRLFGNPTVVREQARATWSWQWLESLSRDIRQGIRRLRRAPSFALTAILVLALGIGANIALFAVVNAVLLKPLPVAHPDRLVRIYEAKSNGTFQDNVVAGGCFARWQTEARSFVQMGIMQRIPYNLASTGAQMPEVVGAEAASWNALPMLGVHSAIGRLFTADDDRLEANATVILSWGLWKRRYGGDPALVGRTILVDAKPYTVVGVLPAWFRYPDARTQLWTPLYHEKSHEIMQVYGSHNFDVIGELKPGISIAQANADLNTIQRQIRLQNPDGPVNDAVNLRPILDGQVRNVKSGLYALLAATGCLLLIACLNIANLLVARAASRGRETAIRTALGGSRVQLIRAQIVESLILSAAGGVLGMALAYGAVQWLVHVRADLPRVDTIHIDGAVALFTAGCVALCGLLAGVLPALASNDRELVRALQESSRSVGAGRGRARMRRLLLTTEVGLTVVLLVAAGLLLKSYNAMRASGLGCATHGVLTMSLSQPRGMKTPDQLVAFYDDLLQRIRQIPGVRAAAGTTLLPGQGRNRDDVFTIREHPPLPKGQVLDATTIFADPGYFQAMQIPLVAGRTFNSTDRLKRADKVIISQELARENFKGEDPLGKHIVAYIFSPEPTTFEIIGVVADTRELPAADPRPAFYFPLLAGSESSIMLTVRTTVDPAALAEPVKRAVASIDSNLPVADVMTMGEVIGQAALDTSFAATLLAGFAALSLVLAAVGLFGVLSFVVAQRTTEIGVRVALGASRGEVLLLMLFDGLRPALAGLFLGLAGAAAVTQLMKSLLVDTRPLDLTVYILVSTVLLVVASLACLVPAWSASRLDPMQALRTE